MLGTSAWYAPGAAVAYLVDSIYMIKKNNSVFCIFEGEYGQADICIGVPVVVGKNGWEKIIDLDLMIQKKSCLKRVPAVRNMNDALKAL